ncbi:MAG: ACT domain-containing protein [Oscillospiraceae bacterium]|jgi:chorismate mutase|nr:ACT domain-containing protein [Oscillospiraceae bacterium]
MPGTPKYYLVEASAMPEVFLKVAEALHNLETGKAENVSEAVKLSGLSRSAFYKYRDAIKPFYKSSSEGMVTFHMILVDAPGVLSAILKIFAELGANILTINQSIPVNGVASVTVSAETGDMKSDIYTLLDHIGALREVTKIEIVAG